MQKRILVIGAGEVGMNTAERLQREGCHVTLIEQDQQRAERAEQKLDIRVIVGSGSHLETLHRAEVKDQNLAYALTQSDETNL